MRKGWASEGKGSTTKPDSRGTSFAKRAHLEAEIEDAIHAHSVIKPHNDRRGKIYAPRQIYAPREVRSAWERLATDAPSRFRAHAIEALRVARPEQMIHRRGGSVLPIDSCWHPGLTNPPPMAGVRTLRPKLQCRCFGLQRCRFTPKSRGDARWCRGRNDAMPCA
jgi:hypothetical protein